jgi:hypothetical protein
MTSASVRDPLADHLVTPENAAFPSVYSTVNVRRLGVGQKRGRTAVHGG